MRGMSCGRRGRRGGADAVALLPARWPKPSRTSPGWRMRLRWGSRPRSAPRNPAPRSPPRSLAPRSCRRLTRSERRARWAWRARCRIAVAGCHPTTAGRPPARSPVPARAPRAPATTTRWCLPPCWALTRCCSSTGSMGWRTRASRATCRTASVCCSTGAASCLRMWARPSHPRCRAMEQRTAQQPSSSSSSPSRSQGPIQAAEGRNVWMRRSCLSCWT
mmetsp:Transcript_19802/g.43058  ORF Transcript_19802/g.43058 Transcript_19802/m.43058 type:complete len:219 (+) Transcript_19802:689-1345(+)